MIRALEISGFVLVGLTLIFLAILVVRRAQLSRRSRKYSSLETELQPIALQLIDGDDQALDSLSSTEAEILARILSRYSHVLTRDSRSNITAFFERQGAVGRAIQDLKSRRTWIRAEAAFTLGDMGSQTAVGPLIGVLKDDVHDVRCASARSLGKLGDPQATRPLIASMVEKTVPKITAAQALLELGPGSIGELEDLLDSRDPAVCETAIELIGLSGSANDEAALISKLRDPSAKVRAAAATALGRIGSVAGARELRLRLQDRIVFVRATVAEAISRIGDRGATEDLIRQAKTDHFDAARAAARAVAILNPQAVLDEVISDPCAGAHLNEAASRLKAAA